MGEIPNGGASAVKVKLICSYGGRIQPRQRDQQLSYVGGESKILTVDRNIKLQDIVEKLQALCSFKGDAICIKYQLPGEDLDVLISLINEDDLENMMIEYDRLQKKISPEKPMVRFRLFLASVNTNDESKQALDSVKDAAANPDYLFGLDKAMKDCSPSNPQLQGFDLGLWSIPKAVISGNNCSSNLNESEKQESREVHVAANGVPALVYNIPIPAQNGGSQTASHYGVGIGRMVPVHSANGYREQPFYFMAPASVHSAPEQRKITAAAPCMVCGDGQVDNNNKVRNV